MPRLVVHAPDGSRQLIELSDQVLKFGRAESCDVVLRHDAEVSRVHAVISVDDRGRIVVEDRNSKNGTRVDEGEVFRNTRRFASRSVRIGEHEIEVLDAPPPDGSRVQPVRFTNDEGSTIIDTQFFPSSRGFDLNQQRLQLLIRLGERIGGVFERKQLLEQALDACCEALGFERGLIALKTQRGDTELPVTRNVDVDETGAYKVSRTLINRAMIHGERAIVNNPATDLLGNISESLVRFPICSALCVPIMNREAILGVIYGDRVTQAQTYQPGDVDFLAAIAQQVGVGLANLQLFQEHLRSQKMYAELKQARDIQNKLLPEEPLAIGRIAIEGWNEASSAVSGDLFDYFELENGRVGVIIADVTGHGMAAALVMANLQSAVRVALSGETPLPDLAARVNRLIYRNTASSVFITGIIGTIDPQTGVLEWVNAGHPPPVRVFRHGVEAPDDENSLPLGVDADEHYAVMRAELGADLRAVLFYTDGLSEAANRDGVLLGVEPLLSRVRELPEVSCEALIRCACDVVHAHLDGIPRADDMTLLAIHARQ
ncbi:MAG: SpoIIE family protein phosphatase [Phycisphaerae bacterium]|jgi:serine phosphatase RsbU (regulator of sigma subunit)